MYMPCLIGVTVIFDLLWARIASKCAFCHNPTHLCKKFNQGRTQFYYTRARVAGFTTKSPFPLRICRHAMWKQKMLKMWRLWQLWLVQLLWLSTLTHRFDPCNEHACLTKIIWCKTWRIPVCGKMWQNISYAYDTHRMMTALDVQNLLSSALEEHAELRL